MSPYCYCRDCVYADKNRVQGEHIRCRRWSTWVSPVLMPCDEFLYKATQQKEDDHG